MKSIQTLKELTAKIKGQTGSTQWVKKADVEREREERYKEEQAKREEERRRKQEEKLSEIRQFYKTPEPKNTPGDQSEVIEKKREEIPRDEVKQRLRSMRQPVTLFGEGDDERYMRLLALEEK